jgi:hypothetical protein
MYRRRVLVRIYVQEAGPGADIGVKIGDRVRENDVVYKVIE